MSQSAKQKASFTDDEMRPEYDFSRGLRGVHAYRFSKLSSDEALVLGYWQGQGFEVGSFAKNEMRDFKTPDFRLSREGVERAFCEVKSFQRDTWLEDKLKSARAGELVGGRRPDPIFNRISNAVHTAFKQFESVNSDHRLLNFLFLTNHDASAGYKDLIRTLTGLEDPLNGCFDPTCTQFSEGRIHPEKGKIDVYFWLDLLKSGEVDALHHVMGNPETRQAVCDLLGLDSAKVRDIPQQPRQ
jgi:hypothetical protein